MYFPIFSLTLVHGIKSCCTFVVGGSSGWFSCRFLSAVVGAICAGLPIDKGVAETSRASKGGSGALIINNDAKKIHFNRLRLSRGKWRTRMRMHKSR